MLNILETEKKKKEDAKRNKKSSVFEIRKFGTQSSFNNILPSQIN